MYTSGMLDIVLCKQIQIVRDYNHKAFISCRDSCMNLHELFKIINI